VKREEGREGRQCFVVVCTFCLFVCVSAAVGGAESGAVNDSPVDEGVRFGPRWTSEFEGRRGRGKESALLFVLCPSFVVLSVFLLLRLEVELRLKFRFLV
jgi:hypothetical protein